VNEKKELYTAVYPNSEIMGWYVDVFVDGLT
jgi:hypothetical protein